MASALRLSEALEVVDLKFGVTMYAIATHGDLDSGYVYRLRTGEKTRPSLETLLRLVHGIRAVSVDAARWFVNALYGFGEDVPRAA